MSGRLGRLTEDGGELQDLADHRDVASDVPRSNQSETEWWTELIYFIPLDEYVLVPNYGLADTVCLIFDAAVFENHLARDEGAFEFEGHLCCSQKGVCSSDIVEQACEIVGFRVIRPRREVGFDHGSAYS